MNVPGDAPTYLASFMLLVLFYHTGSKKHIGNNLCILFTTEQKKVRVRDAFNWKVKELFSIERVKRVQLNLSYHILLGDHSH